MPMVPSPPYQPETSHRPGKTTMSCRIQQQNLTWFALKPWQKRKSWNTSLKKGMQLLLSLPALKLVMPGSPAWLSKQKHIVNNVLNTVTFLPESQMFSEALHQASTKRFKSHPLWSASIAAEYIGTIIDLVCIEMKICDPWAPVLLLYAPVPDLAIYRCKALTPNWWSHFKIKYTQVARWRSFCRKPVVSVLWTFFWKVCEHPWTHYPS